MAAVKVMSASGTSRNDNRVLFDTDSKPIGINSRCTACISEDINDFIGGMRESGRAIKGFGGTQTMSGTIVWRWCDDNGLIHWFVILNSYYVPQGGVRLLSPQHWAKEQRDSKPLQGTGSDVNAKEATLYWNQRRHQLTVPLGASNNVATLHMAPGFDKFEAFCTEIEADLDDVNPIGSGRRRRHSRDVRG